MEFKGDFVAATIRLCAVDIETEWNLKCFSFRYTFYNNPGRYRNRVEFKGRNKKSGAVRALGRYRNRVEFKVISPPFYGGTHFVDIETEWNLKPIIRSVFGSVGFVDIETEWNLKNVVKHSFDFGVACRYRNRVEFKAHLSSVSSLVSPA